jgi:hypothetical protein
LYKWLGTPAEAKELAPEFAAKIIRRVGFTKELFAKHCSGRWPMDPSMRREKVRVAINSLPKQVRGDKDQLQDALLSIAKESIGDSGETVISNGLSALSHELILRLSDGRCDYALAIELLKQLESMMAQAAGDCRAGQIGDAGKDLENKAEPSVSLTTIADTWLWELICRNTADMFSQLVSSIADVRETISDHASTLAQCVGLVSLRLNGDDEEVWRFVDEGIRNRVGPVLETLRKQVSSTVVGESLSPNTSSRMSCEQLLQYLLDDAIPLIATALSWSDDPIANDRQADGKNSQENRRSSETEVSDQKNRSRYEHSHNAANSTVRRQSSSDTQCISTSIALTDIGQAPTEPDLANRRWDDSSVIAAAIRSVRPVLLACGGYQRLLLIAGSEPELERLETRIREVHNGPLTTTVVTGSAATLICEAQQIQLADVQSRITTIAATDQDVMSRLASRNDIDWKSTTRGRN